MVEEWVGKELPLVLKARNRLVFKKYPWKAEVVGFEMPKVLSPRIFFEIQAYLSVPISEKGQVELPFADIWQEDGKFHMEWMARIRRKIYGFLVFDVAIPSGLTVRELEKLLTGVFANSKAIVKYLRGEVGR